MLEIIIFIILKIILGLNGELILSEIMDSDFFFFKFFLIHWNLLRFVLGGKYYSSSIQTIS